MWVVDTTVGINVLGGGLVCVCVVGGFGNDQIHVVRGPVWCVGLAGNNSMSLGVLWWCVGLAGNNSCSLGVLCALSL